MIIKNIKIDQIIEKLFVKKLMSRKEEDPLSALKTLSKGIFYGFSAAFLASLAYGAYDSGFRHTLKRKFPFAAWLLSLYFGEESPVVLDPAVTSHEAVKFKSAFLDDNNNK